MRYMTLHYFTLITCNNGPAAATATSHGVQVSLGHHRCHTMVTVKTDLDSDRAVPTLAITAARSLHGWQLHLPKPLTLRLQSGGFAGVPYQRCSISSSAHRRRLACPAAESH